jgi:hypothetical protein
LRKIFFNKNSLSADPYIIVLVMQFHSPFPSL